MRCKKLILIRYKRFNLSTISRLEYTPESQEQVILGSNGAGKSSLLRAIYNLVPTSASFEPGGGQEYHLEHNGQLFTLISMFKTKAGHHQFILNGIDLNDGNTQATQKELVQRYFNLDQDLIDLATGKVKLSTMKPNERRDWMMRISGTDFEYALKLHDQFKTRTRDLKGTIAYLLENTHKMAAEIESLEEDYQFKDDEVRDLKNIMDRVTDVLQGYHVDGQTQNLIRKMNEAYAKVMQRSQTIVAETTIRNQRFHGKDHLAIEQEMVNLRDRMMQVRGECDVHEKALEGIQSLINHVGRESLDDPSQLTTRLTGIEEELAGILEQGPLYDCGEHSVDNLIGVAEGIQQQLAEVCASLPANREGQYGRGKYQQHLEERGKLSQHALECSNMISKLEATLEHAEHTADTNCPKCEHRFKPGWDPQLLASTKQSLANYRDSLEQANRRVEELQIYIDEFDGYSAKVGELARLRSSSLILSQFWNTVSDKGYIRDNPAMIPVLLQDTLRRLLDTGYALRLQVDQKELLGRLELIKNSGDPKYLLARADLLENELHEKTAQLGDMVQDTGTLSEELYHLEKLDKLTAELDQAAAEFNQYRQMVETALQVEHLDGIRTKVMARLGVLHTQTQRYRDLTARYNNSKEEIIEAETRFASFKLITRALSPTEGIIAEVVKQFIHHLLHMINFHVGLVWTYPMEVGAILEEGATLNCKMPISINGEPNLDGDVADGSTGQVSMIDFAWKLVVFELLGMHDYPLLADEFGKDFDDEHRERLVNYIQSLMEQGRFSQLFMVSHYASVYGSFNQAEFVVLDDRNITRPGDANQHVVIS